MKTSAVSLLLLVFTACFAQAGSFGGPPPFTNGSPLLSGVDGTYQGSIRGTNLSGYVKFTYTDGVQTDTIGSNVYVYFYQGQAILGPLDVAIDDGSVAGVFENATTFAISSTTNSTSTESTVVRLSPPSGYFNGSIDNNSPNGSFKGSGKIGSVSTTTYQNITTGEIRVSTGVEEIDIKVKGVRVTTG